MKYAHSYVAVIRERDGKHFAFADTIRSGQNILCIIEGYKAKVVHLCNSRIEAENLALAWNTSFKENNTFECL